MIIPNLNPTLNKLYHQKAMKFSPRKKKLTTKIPNPDKKSYEDENQSKYKNNNPSRTLSKKKKNPVKHAILNS